MVRLSQINCLTFVKMNLSDAMLGYFARDADTMKLMRRDDIVGLNSDAENTRAGRHPLPALPNLSVLSSDGLMRRCIVAQEKWLVESSS